MERSCCESDSEVTARAVLDRLDDGVVNALGQFATIMRRIALGNAVANGVVIKSFIGQQRRQVELVLALGQPVDAL
jgi:hypothetical protein